MKRGELYMADLNPVIGSEQGGRRPVLIIQNDVGNRHAPTVIVLPLTGSGKKHPLPTHVTLYAGEGGLWRESVVLCEQVRTLEKTRLSQYIGTLSSERMRPIERALSISLDILAPRGTQ